MPSLLDAALSYAARGWLVFPLKPKDKVPATEHGLHDATTDPEKIRSWWVEEPNYNVAIRTGPESGVFVLDVDCKKEDGFISMRVWEEEHGEVPDTLTVRTGSGGLHVFFKYPTAVHVGNRTNVLPGVDVRGAGGYVVAPPSIHPSGGVYEWIKP